MSTPTHQTPISYSGGVNKGEPYSALEPVVGVDFLYFAIFGEQIPAHSCFELRERTLRDFVYNEHLAIHVLELPKFDRRREENDAGNAGELHIPSTPLGRWVYFLRRAGAEDEVMKKIKVEESMIAEAEDRYQRFLAEHERLVLVIMS